MWRLPLQLQPPPLLPPEGQADRLLVLLLRLPRLESPAVAAAPPPPLLLWRLMP